MRTVEVYCKKCGRRLGSVSTTDGRAAMLSYLVRNTPLIEAQRHAKQNPLDLEPASRDETYLETIELDDVGESVETWHEGCYYLHLSGATLRAKHFEGARDNKPARYSVVSALAM